MRRPGTPRPKLSPRGDSRECWIGQRPFCRRLLVSPVPWWATTSVLVRVKRLWREVASRGSHSTLLLKEMASKGNGSPQSLLLLKKVTNRCKSSLPLLKKAKIQGTSPKLRLLHRKAPEPA